MHTKLQRVISERFIDGVWHGSRNEQGQPIVTWEGTIITVDIKEETNDASMGTTDKPRDTKYVRGGVSQNSK